MDQDRTAEGDMAESSVGKSKVDAVCKLALSHKLLSQNDVAAIRTVLNEKRLEVSAQSFVRVAIQLEKMTLFQGKLLLSKDANSLTLGTYLILDKIGQGGMGSVYKAKHKTMDRVVAIKVLRKQSTLSSESIKRFQREVLAAGKLIHPNIVTAFDAGEQNGVHYLVMEFVDGEDLKSLLDRKGALSVSEAVNCILQASKALQYAHEKQIIHRDIKPANLLLDREGIVKVLDMGLARIIHEAEDHQQNSLTADGAVMGTLDYLPPEQSFDTKSADARSDIYSLGCTLFTLLTGRPVYPGNTLVQKILAHREAPIPSIRESRPDVSEHLDSLVKRMLAKDPALRPQTMADVIEALQSVEISRAPTTDAAFANTITTQDDAFLETLIFADTHDKVSANMERGITQNTIVSSVPPASKVVASKKSKHQSAKPLFWGAFAVIGVLILTLMGVWVKLSSPSFRNLVLSFSGVDEMALRDATIVLDNGSEIPVVVGLDKQQVISVPLDNATHTLEIKKKGFKNFSHSFRGDNDNSLSVTVVMTPQVPTPRTSNILLTFAGEEWRESVIRLDDGVVIPVKPDAKNQQYIRLPIDALSHTLQVEKEGHDAFVHKFRFDDPQSLSATVKLHESSKATDPQAEIPASILPTLAESSRSNVIEPRTIVVGMGEGEIPDLMDAIKQANPRDTILVRHRGPLEIDQIDLTGKVPLVIQGDQQAGINFWPIIRQRQGGGPDSEGARSRGALFFGERLEIFFKNLHLAVGGPNRSSLSSVFSCSSGSVEFENCTFTASTDNAERLSEGSAINFVSHTGKVTDLLEVRLFNTFVRGGRLRSLLQISSPARAAVITDNLAWAGGQGALVEVGHGQSSANLIIKNSTIYNISKLLNVPKDRLNEKIETILSAELTNSIVVAREKGRSDFVGIDDGVVAGEDSRWQKLLAFRCNNVVVSNFDTWLPSVEPVTKISDFKKLFDLPAEQVIEKLPRFRLYPTGIELQESNPRDLEAMEAWTGKASDREVDELATVGFDSHKLPVTLSRIVETPLSTPELAVKPRGLPIVIEVNQKNGPARSLEEAFAKIQGDDVVIEITDSHTYRPTRNFGVDSKPGVLFSELASHVSIRAANGFTPKIILSDSPRDQIGTIPDLSMWYAQHASQLFLFYINCQTLELDGLKIEMEISQGTAHSVLATNAKVLKVTNCKVEDRSLTGHGICRGRNGYFVVVGDFDPKITLGANIYWVENVVVKHVLPNEKLGAGLVPDVHASTVFSFSPVGGHSSHVSFRNVFVQEHLVVVNSLLDGWFKFENCTVIGKLFSLKGNLRVAEMTDNLIFATANAIETTPPEALGTINVVGENNAIWMLDVPVTAASRNQGFLRWFPGPLLKSAPVLDRTSLQPKKGQVAFSLATDGGSVGVKTDRILNFRDK